MFKSEGVVLFLILKDKIIDLLFLCHKDVAGWLLICEIVNFYQLRRFSITREGDGTAFTLFRRSGASTELYRAAEKLHTSQPSLSSQLRDLENCVGVPLLVRDKRKVALTAAGDCFLQDALAILEQAENAKLRARKIVQEDRQLTIGFVPSAEVNLLPKVLPMFRLRQPDTLIELVSLITTQGGKNSPW